MSKSQEFKRLSFSKFLSRSRLDSAKIIVRANEILAASGFSKLKAIGFFKGALKVKVLDVLGAGRIEKQSLLALFADLTEVKTVTLIL